MGGERGEGREIPRDKLLPACCAKTHRRLESIVDAPLETTESPNDQHARAEALRSQLDHANLADNILYRLRFVACLRDMFREGEGVERERGGRREGGIYPCDLI